MYADDSYSYVQKEEMDRLVLESEGQISVALSDLFQEVKIIETLPESIYIGKHDQFFAESTVDSLFYISTSFHDSTVLHEIKRI